MAAAARRLIPTGAKRYYRGVVRRIDFQRRNIRIAKGTIFRGQVTVGDHTNINAPSFLDECDIGRYCAIGGRLIVRSSNHATNYANMQDLAQREVIGSKVPVAGRSKGPVSIGHTAWLGDSVIIVPGGSVGIGAVIGAGSVVTRPIPDFAIAAGNPARVLKERFEPHVARYLLDTAWWHWSEDRIRDNRAFFEIDFTTTTEEDLTRIRIR